MSDKHSRSVGFTKPQIAWLNDEAERLGVSPAELIRRIIDDRRGAVVAAAPAPNQRAGDAA